METQTNHKEPLHLCVITPTCGRIEFFPEAVHSVRSNVKGGFGYNVDFTFEHLICENACTDGTKEWLADESKKDGANLRYWSVPSRLLPGPARNEIIQYAPENSWLVPLDDDDVMLMRNLYYHAALIKKNPETQWFVNDFVRMDQDRRYLANEDYYAWQFETPKEMLATIFTGGCFIQGNVSYSKKIFDEVGGYHKTLSMAEDLDLYVRFLIAGHMPKMSPHISHLHRFHTGNISIGVDANKHHNDLRMIYERYGEQLERIGIEKP